MKRECTEYTPEVSASLQVAIAICSIGRPEQLFNTLSWLTRQSKRPSQVVIVVTESDDLPDGLAAIEDLPLEIVFSPKGLTRQRNRALEVLAHRCDVIFFMDDDYLAANSAVKVIDSAFRQMHDVSGITGRLLADGINSGGIDAAQACSMISVFEETDPQKAAGVTDRAGRGLYGCNMAFRMSAIGETRFDEALPLYGWQEDVDFSNRVGGKNILFDSLVGVHCGTPSGRETNGRALGYSQIANPVYLLRKGSLKWRHAASLIFKNLAANLWGVWRSKSWENRPDRLIGNLSALCDAAIGRMHPAKIENFKGC